MNAILDKVHDTGLLLEFQSCRRDTLELIDGLNDSVLALHAGAGAETALWRIAMTSRFIEHRVLARFGRPRRPSDAAVSGAAGGGAQTRLEPLLQHRASVDARIAELLQQPVSLMAEAAIAQAIAHEQQQQELLLVDMLGVFARFPLHAQQAARRRRATLVRLARAPGPAWCEFRGGRVAIGRDDEWFAPDCEQPRHELRLRPYALATHLVSNRDWCEFIDDGGYARAALWSAPGWTHVRMFGWQAPLYWRGGLEAPRSITLAGELPLDMDAPVCHISQDEAMAYARWARKRLPSESEWEAAASAQAVAGNFAGSEHRRAMTAHADAQAPLRQLFGDVWEWTDSAFTPYPGQLGASHAFRPHADAPQAPMVLRGGSCATPLGAVRATTRHALAAQQRRHFTGLRLAQDQE
jgi:ergothioneine biosynthesis protein EgtB